MERGLNARNITKIVYKNSVNSYHKGRPLPRTTAILFVGIPFSVLFAKLIFFKAIFAYFCRLKLFSRVERVEYAQ